MRILLTIRIINNRDRINNQLITSSYTNQLTGSGINLIGLWDKYLIAYILPMRPMNKRLTLKIPLISRVKTLPMKNPRPPYAPLGRSCLMKCPRIRGIASIEEQCRRLAVVLLSVLADKTGETGIVATRRRWMTVGRWVGGVAAGSSSWLIQLAHLLSRRSS